MRAGMRARLGLSPQGFEVAAIRLVFVQGKPTKSEFHLGCFAKFDYLIVFLRSILS
jgi:hypothetical protein